MAELPRQFNVEGNEDSLTDYSPIPSGDYIAVIKSSQYRQNKKKTGHYLQFIFSIIEGKYKGRNLFENCNLDNPNQVAVEIANKTLNSICQACDKVGVEDSEELHDIPMTIRVKKVESTPSQPESNDIIGFKKLEDEEVSMENEHVQEEENDDVTQDLPEEGQETPNQAPDKEEKESSRKLPWE